MIGWVQRNREARDHNLTLREDGAAIKHALGEPLTPDDLSGLREEFIVRLMGKDGAAKYFEREHITYAESRRGRRKHLRCRLWSCKPSDACAYWPACTSCAGHCVRCGQPVVAAARSVPK